MSKIAIIGSGDLGRSIAHYAQQNHCDIVGFYDDFETAPQVQGLPILGTLSDVAEHHKQGVFDSLICAVGYRSLTARADIFRTFHEDCGIPFATLVDATCHVDKTATIGEGCVLFPGAFVDKGVTLEHNVLLNVCVTIAHDSRVKAHSFLAPRVAVAGFVTIGERCMLGINATLIDNVTLHDDIRIGGGAVVIDNLTEPGLYVGVPAKWKKP